MSEVLKQRQAPDAVELLRQGRQLGGLQVWACSMALDVLDWDTDRLIEDLFDGARGLTRFLSDAEAGQLVTF
jgi:peroxiredoxin family protein